MLKIVIAPDSYKGTFTAKQVADIMERAVKKVFPDADVVKVPMADGGEGTAQALVDATGGKIVHIPVSGPLMKKVDSFFGILGDGTTAVIEMAAASGLMLVTKEEADPMLTTTYGTGELIRAALDKGCRKLIVGLGGSATNDGGAGAAQALGAKLLDAGGRELGAGGGCLGRLSHIDLSGFDKRLKECAIIIACDVDNPLCGPRGASAVFGPQKGADEKTVRTLDRNLANYAAVVKKDLGRDILNVPGAGAAGGLGGGMIAFMDATIRRGVDEVIETTDLERKLAGAALVLTGEGMIDYQTAFGKTPYGVAMAAKKHGVPVIAIAGSIGKDAETLYDKGFDSIFSTIDQPMTLEEAMAQGGTKLERATERVMRAVRISLPS